MGLLAPLAEFLLHEHLNRPIEGKVLFVGRQTVFLNTVNHGALLKRHGLANRASGSPEFDNETWGARGQRLITDRYFMKSLGVGKVDFLDVSDYEGADIVHDLGLPVPEKYHNAYDFIYNGGCLDNMFNPGVALMNLSRMLRPGGRLVCLESASSWNNPYLIYSPGWFYDYFVVNKFADCKVYLASYGDNDDLRYGPWDLYYADLGVNPNGPSPEAIFGNHLLVVTVAEKDSGSTSDVQPVQAQYRTKAEWVDSFSERAARIRSHPRPIIGKSAEAHSGKEDYLRYLGRIGDRLGSGRERKTVRQTLRIGGARVRDFVDQHILFPIVKYRR